MSKPAGSQSDRPTVARYVVLGWLCAAATIAYVQRNAVAVAESTIRADLELETEQTGWVFSAFFVTYAIFQIPSGWLGDCWGVRWTLSVYAVLWSLATALVSLADGYETLLVARYLAGAAQAGIFPCCTAAVAHWMPETQRGLAAGWLAGFMSVGAVVASATTGWMIDTLEWSWRIVFALFAIPGLLWAAGFYWWFRNRPAEHWAVNEAERERIAQRLAQPRGSTADADAAPEGSTLNDAPRGRDRVHPPERSERTPWLALMTSAAMWAICGQQFFRAAGYNFFTSWFPTFLQESRGVSVAQSGTLTSLPLAAVVIGSLLGGSASDWVLVRTGSRRLARQGVAVLSMLACAVLIVSSYFIRDTVLAVLAISAGSFWAAFGGPCAYAITIDMGGRHVGTVFSTMNMSGNVGAAISPLVFERVQTSSGDWDAVLFVFAGIYVAAALCWLALKPTGSVFDRPSKSGAKL
jgi:MFS family permease